MVAESEHVHKQLEKPIPQHETGRNAKRDTLRSRQRIFRIHDGFVPQNCAGQAQESFGAAKSALFSCVSGLAMATETIGHGR
jgi:hypothetical protein